MGCWPGRLFFVNFGEKVEVTGVNGGVVGDRYSCCFSVMNFSSNKSLRMGYIFWAVSM